MENTKWHSIHYIKDNIWKITFHNKCTTISLNTFFLEYKQFLLEKKAKIIIVFDITQLESISMNQVTLIVTFLNSMKITHTKHLHSFELLLSNYFFINLVDLIFSITPPVVPYKIIKSFS